MLSILVSCLAPHLPQPVELGKQVDAQLIPVSAECVSTEITPVRGTESRGAPSPVSEVRITPDGRMPMLPMKLNLKPGFILDGEVRYSVAIEYEERGRSDSAVVGTGAAESREFLLDLGDSVRGGQCHVQLEVPWRMADRRTGVAHVCVDYRVLGENPHKEHARRKLNSIEAQVIAYKESRFRQFNHDGRPLFGPPRGFGLMQLDTPPPTAEEIWDWRHNIEAGLKLFQEKERIARGAPARTRRNHPEATDFTEEELKMEVYQRYNGGAYWGWSDTKRRWVKVSRSKYADDCYALEQAVLSGNPPDDWD